MDKNTINFILKGKLIHMDNDGNSLFEYPNTLIIETKSQEKKVKIICKKHGECLVVPRHHLSNKTGGCSRCRAEKTSYTKIENSKKQWEKDILSTHLFSDGTQKYDYSKFLFTKRDEPGIIICNICKKEFCQAPNHHIERKQGCSACSNIQSGLKQSTPLDEYIKICSAKHADKYNYDKIHETYKSGKSVILIYCKKCEEYFPQKAEYHIIGRGCLICGRVKSSISRTLTTDEFITKSKKIYKNNKIYDYSVTTYVKDSLKLSIKCISCNKIFLITPNNHLRGKGCPSCSHHTSKPARDWLSYIQITKGIILQTFDSEQGEYVIDGTRWKADGYDSDTNTVYEFYGDYWHGNPKKYSKDIINEICKKPMGELYDKTIERENKIKELGYNLIIIWEMEWNELKRQI